jgi:hypothetical protein
VNYLYHYVHLHNYEKQCYIVVYYVLLVPAQPADVPGVTQAGCIASANQGARMCGEPT